MLLNRYRVKSYTLKEFRKEYTSKDITLVERFIDNIKNNKIMYTRLVFITALLLHFNINFVFANDFSTSLDAAGMQILELLMAVAKWGCIAMGVKDMVVTVLNGGNVKNAINNGLIYILAYVFISLYPQLFDLFSKIKF